MRLISIEYPDSTANNFSFALEQQLTMRMAIFETWEVQTNNDHDILNIRYCTSDVVNTIVLKKLLEELKELFDFLINEIELTKSGVLLITNIKQRD
jgi:hypothetical protein